MEWLKDTLEFSTRGKGLLDITREVSSRLRFWKVQEGMCFLYLPHTSASLVINENYDASARKDLATFMDQLAPEEQDWHEHSLEGPDDSPAHMRAMITPVSLSIPVDGGRLALGEWQGIYLFEHRRDPHRREVLVRCLKIS
jgi:secondary thiamine-phosphate synthase enzyme